MQNDDKLYSIGETLTAETEHKMERATHQVPTLGDFTEDAMKAAKECFGSTDQYVHQNSWKVMGMAAAFGLFTGLMIRRK
jgi:ElaB/YqjD/DUF883 family membrane-anchored ribosome-binding protein